MYLGERQRGALIAIVEHDGWNAFFGHWVWDTQSGTVQILESLRRKGLVEYVGSKKISGYRAYRATALGKHWVKVNG